MDVTRTWLVIAAYNEGAMIADVISNAVLTFPNIVVVDDGSRDDSAAIARAAGATSLHAIAAVLNREGVATPRGGAWTATAVRRVMLRVEAETAAPLRAVA